MDDATFTIEDPDGETDEFTIPSGLVDLFTEEDDDSQAQVVTDIALMAFSQRAHMMVAHGQGEPTEEMKEIEEATLAKFEERFGQTFAEATGHDH